MRTLVVHGRLQKKELPRKPINCSFRQHPVWTTAISDRYIDSTFERVIFTELKELLQKAFADLEEDECEEAVQDCICRALEVYRVLRHHAGSSLPLNEALATRALTAYTSRQYRAGVRFASPYHTAETILP